MSESTGPSLDGYWTELDAALPNFTPDEQRTAVALYRALSKGEGVVPADLTSALGVDEVTVRAALERPALECLTYWRDGRILGFGGLAAAEMPHGFRVNGRQLWTWCAWDSLFIPEILGERAEVVSTDPLSKASIELVVTPEGVEACDPASTVVSFVTPDPDVLKTTAENVMTAFCHFVYFFESRETGEEWARKTPGTFLYSLDEASELARRLNRRNFGSVLAASRR